MVSSARCSVVQKYIGCLLLLTSFGICSAQDIKTVAQCRTYREAWNTSVTADVQRLSVAELTIRAEQMLNCGGTIDGHPFEPGMKPDDALTLAVTQTSYSILAAAYYGEAFRRMSWFLNDKKLTAEFVAQDAAKRK